LPEHDATGGCGAQAVVLLADLADRTEHLNRLLAVLDENDQLCTLVDMERSGSGDALATLLARLAARTDALEVLVADLVDSPDRMARLLAAVVEHTGRIDALIAELERTVKRSLRGG
jgi:hypothetical protein